MKNLLAPLFPELGWTKFSADERRLVLSRLDEFGAYGPPAAQYIRTHSTQLGYFPQKYSSAGWTLFRNLTLRPDTNLGAQRTLAGIVHEVLHLQQSISTRLSVYGELLAWQLEYRAFQDVTGKYYGEKGAPFEGTKSQWQQISRLSADAHADLGRAQGLMKQISALYRSDKLPLYPLGREVRYKLLQQVWRD